MQLAETHRDTWIKRMDNEFAHYTLGQLHSAVQYVIMALLLYTPSASKFVSWIDAISTQKRLHRKIGLSEASDFLVHRSLVAGLIPVKKM
jgi:hypothetical protein